MPETDQRPNPEDLLKQIELEEKEATIDNKKHNEHKKGRFKIFLGYCAGVGKTYRMLEEANSAKQHGIDVVIAVAETHGRKETEFLLQGLELIPKKVSQYKELTLEEMDLDAVLKRHPQLAIVDELAHTNSPGSRHSKRYQDVEELLNAGIDVYTTLNIQHIESTVDTIYQITLVKVHETVPNRILEIADEIELVDLAPEKLLERLREGKVYITEKAQTAMNKFFVKGNLLALRELSLRYTAKRVDEDMLSYKASHAILTPWPIGSRLLVAISSSTSSEHLLRIAHRMAVDLGAEWYAVHIESLQQVELNEASQNQLNNNIRLAEELGAHVFALTGTAIAKEILNFSKQKGITLVIVGFSRRSKFDEIFKGSVLNDLIKESGQINILIVDSKNNGIQSKQKATSSIKIDYKSYLLSALSISATVCVGTFLNFWVKSPGISGMLLLIPTLMSSLLWGNKVGLFAAIIAMASLDFFFISPLHTFKITDSRYLPVFLVFIVVSLVIGSLVKLVKWQAESSRRRERFLSSLYSFNREMMMSKTYGSMLSRAAKYISEAFESHVIVLLPDKNENLEIQTQTNNAGLNENERAAATWVYKNGVPAGKNTPTLSSLSWYYLPLNIKDKTIGVIAVAPINVNDRLSSEQNRLLESFANLVALTVYKTL